MREIDRVLFSPGFLPIRGGVSSFMQARAMANPKGLLVVASDHPNATALDREQPFKVRRFHYPFERPLFGPLRRLAQLRASASALYPILRQYRPKCLELASPYPGALLSLLWPRSSGMEIVSFAHGDDLLRPLNTSYANDLFKRSLQRIDRFVANSRFTKDLLISTGIHSDRVSVINPPIDRQRFARKGDANRIKALLPSHDLVMLTLTRLVSKKGIDTVLSLLPKLLVHHPGLIYVVAGSGEDEARLRHLAGPSADRVCFWGEVSEADIVDIYAAADVFVMPTRMDMKAGDVEGYGIAFSEAGSQGVPSVAPNEGGSADAVIDGVTGYVVKPRDEEAIFLRLHHLLAHADVRAKMGEAARSKALAHTDWSNLF